MTDYPRMNMKSSIFAEFVKRIKELEEENEQLKELLKRARKHLSEQDTPYYLIKRIDRVLNEKNL